METNNSTTEKTIADEVELQQVDVIKAETYIKNERVHGVGLSIVGRKRKANEDHCGYASVPNGRLFVVCDGMGGHVGGAVASSIAVKSILDYMSRENFKDVRTALAEALAFGNAQILGRTKEDPSLKGMGTTACIVLLCDDKAWIAHVGDSRIYLFTEADKRLYRVTKDHSYVQTLVDAGQLDDRMAEHHPRKNVIMKALGIDEVLRPEVVREPLSLCVGDTFLICSDGLSGMIDDDEIEEILRKEEDLEATLEDLIEAADAPGKGLDNITGQLIRVLYSNHHESIFPDFNPKWRKDRKGIKKERKKTSPKTIAIAVVASLMVLFGLWWWLLRTSGVNEPKTEKDRTVLLLKNKQRESEELRTAIIQDSEMLDILRKKNVSGEDIEQNIKIKKDRLKQVELTIDSLKIQLENLEKEGVITD